MVFFLSTGLCSIPMLAWYMSLVCLRGNRSRLVSTVSCVGNVQYSSPNASLMHRYDIIPSKNIHGLAMNSGGLIDNDTHNGV